MIISSREKNKKTTKIVGRIINALSTEFIASCSQHAYTITFIYNYPEIFCVVDFIRV